MHRSLIRSLVVLAIVVLVGLGVFIVWRSTTFRIIGTTPSTQSVSTVSPYLQIKFSQPISTSGLKVVASSDFIKTPEVSGKTLTIPFVVPLTSGQSYSVTVVSVSSTKGKTITGKVFAFRPTYIPSSQLSKAQQQALLQNESHIGPTFTNMDNLGSYGFNSNQIANVEQEIITFKPAVKQAVVDPSSITVGSYNPSNPNPRAPVLFTVSIDGTNYQASALGNDTSDDIVLTLTNPQTGAQIYQGNSAAS